MTSRRTAALDGSSLAAARAETVARELVSRDIVPKVAGLRGPGQQVSDQVAQLLLRSGDVLTSMHECRELGAVVFVRNERVGLEHGID